MLKLPQGRAYPQIPAEKIYQGTIRGLVERIKLLYNEIVNTFGDEGLDLIQRVSADYGRQIADSAREKYGKMELDDIATLMIRIFNGMLAEGEIIQWNDEKVVIMVENCPYPFTNPDVCKAHTTMERQLVENLNPGIEYVIEKCIPRGDSECWHTLKRKK